VAYSVRADRCIRCAACSILAPGVFSVEASAARVVRQPQSRADELGARAALAGCPASAIASVEQ
jgi:ferredoxin